MDSGGPVMTESERRAYRYAKAPRVQGLRNSWSNDSLFSLVGSGSRGGVHSCVCAPTTHPGSFRCKHHRQNASLVGAGAAGHAHAQSTAEADADVKRDEVHEETSSAEQAKES